jgi:GT2 family glycosyltransferase
VCRGGAACRIGASKPDQGLLKGNRKIWSAPWTAALFRRKLFERTGGLEESFESYLEDVDFGLRCAMHGCYGVYVADAMAWHLGSASLGRWNARTVRLMTRNQLWLIARHHSAARLRYLWPAIVAQGLWAGLAIRHASGLAWLQGLKDGLAGFSRAKASGCAWAPAELEAILSGNERLIYESQSASGFDTFWKAYFLMAGRGAK